MTIGGNATVIFIGAIAPLAVVMVTVPAYLSLIGPERYGILLLIWIVLDYFAIFGVGLDASTTNHLARHRDDKTAREEIFWSAILVNAVLGLLGGLAVFFVGTFLLSHTALISDEYRTEILTSIPWIAAAIPVITVSAVLTGTLQAFESFVELTVLQFIGSIVLQVAPLAVAFCYGPDLLWLVAAAVLSRLAIGGLLMIAVVHVLKIGRRVCFSLVRMKSLVKFGSWVAVTGLISPILVNLDRVLIGWILGAANVAYYTVPYNIVNKISMLPFSLVKALFPRFSIYDRQRALSTSHEAIMSLAVILAPLLITGMFVCTPFLQLWLGKEFAGHAQGIGEILIAGLWFNCLAYIPFAFLQAQGRPDLVAKLHMLELAPFAVLLWLALILGGLKGAALAWSIRVAADSFLLFYVSGQLRTIFPYLAFPTGMVLVVLALTIFVPRGLGWYAVLAIVLIFSVCIWAAASAPEAVRNMAMRFSFRSLSRRGNTPHS